MLLQTKEVVAYKQRKKQISYGIQGYNKHIKSKNCLNSTAHRFSLVSLTKMKKFLTDLS